MSGTPAPQQECESPSSTINIFPTKTIHFHFNLLNITRKIIPLIINNSNTLFKRLTSRFRLMCNHQIILDTEHSQCPVYLLHLSILMDRVSHYRTQWFLRIYLFLIWNTTRTNTNHIAPITPSKTVSPWNMSGYLVAIDIQTGTSYPHLPFHEEF